MLFIFKIKNKYFIFFVDIPLFKLYNIWCKINKKEVYSMRNMRMISSFSMLVYGLILDIAIIEVCAALYMFLLIFAIWYRKGIR